MPNLVNPEKTHTFFKYCFKCKTKNSSYDGEKLKIYFYNSENNIQNQITFHIHTHKKNL